MLERIEDCVHCGFCLPTCPTYALWSEEMDSPRGRIVLMKESLEGELSAEMVTHFDRCLGCMACVTACPSGVRYDTLITDMRERVEREYRRPLRERVMRRALFSVLPYPRRLRALRPFLPLARFAALAPRATSSVELPEVTPAVGERRGRVGFLQGCVQRAWFGDVNRATAAVLAAEGFEVFAPRRPGCCGSLELHAGAADAARRRARETIAAFDGCDVVVTNAAGCGSGMREYGHLLHGDPAAEAFSARVRDVTEVLAALEPRAPRRRVDLRVAYHDACHLAHAQGVREAPRELLRTVPGLGLLEPEDWELCCGSAGIYNLVEPQAAAELGRRKARALLATGAEAIAAANPGCTLQIGAHLRELGRPLPVLHPMEILHRSIADG